MSRELLQKVINEGVKDNLHSFFLNVSNAYREIEDDLSAYDDDRFANFQAIGEIVFNANEKLVVVTAEVLGDLTERSGKKAQYEKAKKILKAYMKYDAGFFVFSDPTGSFRFSLVYGLAEGTRKSWSNFRRFTYLASREQTNKTFLGRVGGCDFSSLDIIKDAFSVEKVNKEFYKEIAKYYYRLTGKNRYGRELVLPSVGEDDAKKYEEYAVRLIGRAIFCWFLKHKKSANGVPLIPQEALSVSAVQIHPDYYHSILEPLFFEVMNKPFKDRKSIAIPEADKIPFLNGGLFEPHRNDYYQNAPNYALKIPDRWFEDFFTVLEQYNFTIDENSIVDADVSVDPEMLGRIFENLLAEVVPETWETARKATGSYYTPRTIVDYMVDQSLKQYLVTKTKISEDKITALLSYEAPDVALSENEKGSIISALDEIKIIDPACGSGAFPMGILHKMLLVLQKADPDLKIWLKNHLGNIEPGIFKDKLLARIKNENWEYVRKLLIIQKSIYGVDIQTIAVEISKLRFFLSLIVDEQIDDAKGNRGVEALPNLEFKFVAANSLIGLPPLFDRQLDLGFGVADKIARLRELRNRYLRSSGQEKKEIENDFLKTRGELVELNINLGGKDAIALQLASWNPFANEKCGWFDPEWMFGIEDGFDIVIANPPYNARLTEEERRLYKNKFESVSSGRQDTAAIFVELAKKIGSKEMQFAYILPYRLFSRKRNHGQFQIYTLNNFSIHEIIYLGSNIGFSSSDEFMILTMALNHEINNKVKIALRPDIDQLNKEINFIEIEQNKFIEKGEVDINLVKYDRTLLLKLEQNACLLGYICHVKDGIIVHIRDKLISNNKKDNRYVKFAGISGKYILQKYFFRYDELYLCYDLNEAKKYITDKSELRKVQLRERGIFLERKILTAQNSATLKGTLDECKTFVSNSLHSTYLKDEFRNSFSLEYLLALINSQLLDYYHDSLRLKGTDLHPQILISNLKKLPIKHLPFEGQKPFIEMVDRILCITKDEDYLSSPTKQAKVKEYERQIDQMVYELYGLTPEEIAVVEGKGKQYGNR